MCVQCVAVPFVCRVCRCAHVHCVYHISPSFLSAGHGFVQSIVSSGTRSRWLTNGRLMLLNVCCGTFGKVTLLLVESPCCSQAQFTRHTHAAHFTLYASHIALHTSLFTLRTSHFALCNSQCNLHTTQQTLLGTLNTALFTHHTPHTLRMSHSPLHATHFAGDMQQLLPVHRFARDPAAYCLKTCAWYGCTVPLQLILNIR